jgi:hypothetical protein
MRGTPDPPGAVAVSVALPPVLVVPSDVVLPGGNVPLFTSSRTFCTLPSSVVA